MLLNDKMLQLKESKSWNSHEQKICSPTGMIILMANL
jgi:hypothetical protein